ncbi:CdaR family transcriptional regulator [Conexibacter sp. SYSU D00693]|uniref:PucR family transcriptional regulator n=1 Tax=Conexibacter sp. SYSU D00693 TaxID=2812560 RepID=UPI00196A55DB|nr:PucR family transcriptional regulator [Conexibacter sp. SYSU D00693]
MVTAWERPSPHVAELIRQGCELLLGAPEGLFDQVDDATLAGADPGILADPALVEAIRRTNRANLLHWARANLEDPGARVAPNLVPGTVAIARDLVRRGLDWSSLDAYRTGQNVAWRAWMGLAFSLTHDPDELSELLDVTARSIFTFVDETIAGLGEHLQRERDRLRRGTHAERLEVVTLVLEGAPISQERASSRLGYALDGPHTAAVVFSDAATPDPGLLERAAEVLARTAGARRPFTVTGSAASLWVWLPGEAGPDREALARELPALPEARIALGPTLPGMAGFRRSHLDALAVQRLLHRTSPDVRLATFDDVQVVALATQDEERAREFVERTLGALASGPAELRDTLRTYLREEHNASATAKVLFTHRNTVLNRLARAEELLPAPLAGRALPVALALEVVRWVGAR